MKIDRTFVRTCQSPGCGTVFEIGQSECSACGRHRSQRCWTIGIYGAFRGQDLAAVDALDHEFNTDVFVGRVRGQLFCISDRTWSLTEPVVQLGTDGSPQDGTVAIAMALEEAGLEVLVPRSSPFFDSAEPSAPASLFN